MGTGAQEVVWRRATAQKGAGAQEVQPSVQRQRYWGWRAWKAQTTGQGAAWHPGQGCAHSRWVGHEGREQTAKCGGEVRPLTGRAERQKEVVWGCKMRVEVLAVSVGQGLQFSPQR